MFTAALITVTIRWKQPSVHQWKNGWVKCRICLQWVYITFSLKGRISDTCSVDELEDTTLSEIGQSQKDKYRIIPLL